MISSTSTYMKLKYSTSRIECIVLVLGEYLQKDKIGTAMIVALDAVMIILPSSHLAVPPNSSTYKKGN